MYPLIEIKSVPIEIQMKTKHASLEYTRGTAEMEITRNDKGLEIKSRPIKLQMDSFEARSSLRPTTVQSVDQAAQQGKQASYEATATYAQQGKLFLNAKVGESVIEKMSVDSTMEDTESTVNMDFLPSTGVNISWEDGEMQIRYEMDKMNFDWKISQGEFKFTPGDIEISIAQQPDVIIRYVGGPLYVPPSSDPNYKAVDIHA